MDAEVNWLSYFESIKKVCPWSHQAWRQGTLNFVEWQSEIYPLGSFSARIYIAQNHNPRQLKKMCNRFNQQRPDEEWLWSHPVYGFNSTPVPVFIQQHRKTLENIRLSRKNSITDK